MNPKRTASKIWLTGLFLIAVVAVAWALTIQAASRPGEPTDFSPVPQPVPAPVTAAAQATPAVKQAAAVTDASQPQVLAAPRPEPAQALATPAAPAAAVAPANQGQLTAATGGSWIFSGFSAWFLAAVLVLGAYGLVWRRAARPQAQFSR